MGKITQPTVTTGKRGGKPSSPKGGAAHVTSCKKYKAENRNLTNKTRKLIKHVLKHFKDKQSMDLLTKQQLETVKQKLRSRGNTLTVIPSTGQYVV